MPDFRFRERIIGWGLAVLLVIDGIVWVVKKVF
jgi:hypothetical protein